MLHRLTIKAPAHFSRFEPVTHEGVEALYDMPFLGHYPDRIRRKLREMSERMHGRDLRPLLKTGDPDIDRQLGGWIRSVEPTIEIEDNKTLFVLHITADEPRHKEEAIDALLQAAECFYTEAWGPDAEQVGVLFHDAAEGTIDGAEAIGPLSAFASDGSTKVHPLEIIEVSPYYSGTVVSEMDVGTWEALQAELEQEAMTQEPDGPYVLTQEEEASLHKLENLLVRQYIPAECRTRAGSWIQLVRDNTTDDPLEDRIEFTESYLKQWAYAFLHLRPGAAATVFFEEGANLTTSEVIPGVMYLDAGYTLEEVNALADAGCLTCGIFIDDPERPGQLGLYTIHIGTDTHAFLCDIGGNGDLYAPIPEMLAKITGQDCIATGQRPYYHLSLESGALERIEPALREGTALGVIADYDAEQAEAKAEAKAEDRRAALWEKEPLQAAQEPSLCD